MKGDRASRYLMLGALALAVLLVLTLLAHVRTLEKRLETQGQAIRTLGETTERLGAGSASIAALSPLEVDETPPGVKVLHPEVANFLKPPETRWPVAGARRDGVLGRSFEYGDPKGFNILLESSGILEERIYAYCRIRLAEPRSWTDPGTYYGTLAFRLEITDDSKEFTAYLRPRVKWHEVSGVDVADPKYAWLRGDHEVTAHDLVFTLDLILNPQVQAGRWKNFYAGLESYKAIDDRTLVVRWKRKEYLNLTATMGLWATPRFLYAYDEAGKALPKETLGMRFNQHWYDGKGYVGAGPYRMASYEPGSQIVLERNERYFGQKPAIQKLVYPIYSDSKQTLMKLRARELGDGELTPAQYREEILDHERAGKKPQNSPFFDGSIRCRKIPRPAYSYVAWNGARPMFSDKRVRRAMTHAFDRQRIIDNVYVGLGTVATGPYPSDSPNSDPEIQPLPFDLSLARKLLGEAGWSDTDGDGLLDKELRPGDGKRVAFEFRLSLPVGQKEAESTATIFADALSKIGVKMTLDLQEWSLLQKKKDEREFDAYVASWTTPWVPDLYDVWHSSQADLPKGANVASFRNAEADRVIEELRITFDEAKRVRLFRAFHRIVHDEQPYTIVMVRKKVHCAWSSVKNLVYAKDVPTENSLPWWVDNVPR
jgi:peptide/nickel transport system substrate-binding protein